MFLTKLGIFFLKVDKLLLFIVFLLTLITSASRQALLQSIQKDSLQSRLVFSIFLSIVISAIEYLQSSVNLT